MKNNNLELKDKKVEIMLTDKTHKVQEYEPLDEYLNAMELTVEQRREIMDLIMQEALDTAINEVPYSGNIFDDNDEADEARDKRFKIGVQKMLQLKEQYGFPISKYDRETKRAYVQFPNGHREYFD